MEALKQDIEKHPDKYQYERAEQFGVTQVAISFIKSFKKILPREFIKFL
jgi:hypothetical protein